MGTMTTEAVELLVAVLRSRGKHNSLHDITRAADALASITRERDGYQKHLRACEQIAGKALGYPWFKNDQANFPGTTEAEGVCIGEHVGDTIVEELANAYIGTIDRALEDLERTYPGAFWVLGYGKTKADEPPFGVRVLFGCDEILAEGEGATAVEAIRAAALVNGEASDAS